MVRESIEITWRNKNTCTHICFLTSQVYGQSLWKYLIRFSHLICSVSPFHRHRAPKPIMCIFQKFLFFVFSLLPLPLSYLPVIKLQSSSVVSWYIPEDGCRILAETVGRILLVTKFLAKYKYIYVLFIFSILYSYN